jgi:hypothetical protein
MIEKMGGSVSVDSIEGVGTTFAVELLIKSKKVHEECVEEESKSDEELESSNSH